MDDLFPRRKRFTRYGESGEVLNEWVSDALDHKAKVVCGSCNNGWMSDLENRHAKIALTDLIIGNETHIDALRAKAIARFAFKMAVIADHMGRGKTAPFFSEKARRYFAKSLTIPRGINMWCAGFLPQGTGQLYAGYGEVEEDGFYLHLFGTTCAIGHFAFQVLAAKTNFDVPPFAPKIGFETLAVPFWPTVPYRTFFPFADVLRTKAQFNKFAERWKAITFDVYGHA